MDRLLNRFGSIVWSSVNSTARMALGGGWIRPVRLGPRTISVGNIQAGGAGKTPLVALIANQAHERGLSVCILCRGYRSAWEVRGGVLRPGSDLPAEESCDPELCGDEAALLRDLAPNAWIAVGADRVARYQEAIKLFAQPFDLVILDDGLQHFKIARDLDVIAVTSATSGEVLFRESTSRVNPGSLLIWTKGESLPEAYLSHPEDRRAKIRFSVSRQGANPRAWLVTGVGSPEHVKSTARQAGYEVIQHLCFPDHARYSEPMVKSLLLQSEQNGCRLVLTGKDWVKWKAFGIDRGRVDVLEPRLVFESGEKTWQDLLWGNGSLVK